MSNPKQFLPILFLIVSLGILLNFTRCTKQAEPTKPQTLGEVMGIARKLGLHCRSERADGEIGIRLLVSEAPLPLERANLLCFGGREKSNKGRSDWVGVVAVYKPGLVIVDSDPVMQWGNLLVYGDPTLMEKLTGNKIGQD